VPTISFNGLAFLTFPREAPNGSIKPTPPRREDIPFYTSQEHKKAAITAAFIARFGIGFVIGAARSPWPAGQSAYALVCS
jgi:hypothetical protein